MYNSQEIANRIKSRAKQQKKSLGEVLTACELGKNTVSKISKGTDILTLNFAKIADQLDCSIDYLLGRTDNPEIAYLKPTPERKMSLYEKPATISNTFMEDFATYETSKGIAILGKVAAGTPILSYEVDYGNIIPENPSASYALIAQGDSMHPVIHDKETIEVISQKILENGEIGIISVDGSMTCKKFYEFADHYELRSINPDYPTMHIEKNPSTNLQIRGKVSLTRAQNNRL